MKIPHISDWRSESDGSRSEEKLPNRELWRTDLILDGYELYEEKLAELQMNKETSRDIWQVQITIRVMEQPVATVEQHVILQTAHQYPNSFQFSHVPLDVAYFFSLVLAFTRVTMYQIITSCGKLSQHHPR